MPREFPTSYEHAPSEPSQPLMLGLSLRRLVVLLLVYLLVLVSVGLLLRVAHRALLDEVRGKARNLAALIAVSIPGDIAQTIRTPADLGRPVVRDLLTILQTAKRTHGDIAFIYIIREVQDERGAHWEFILDAQPYDHDADNDGVIAPDEEGVLPGSPYEDLAPDDATEFHLALQGPRASPQFYTDRWGTFISGMAPVIDPVTGEPVAVLGVDVTRGVMGEKFRLINWTGAFVLIVLLMLFTITMLALSGKARALEEVRRLDAEVQDRNRQLEQNNEVLEVSILELSLRDSTLREELALAQQVQQRFLPHSFPFDGVLEFSTHYRSASIIGGDLYDVFALTDDVAGFFIADVTGHGVSAALITAALKVTVERYQIQIVEIIRGGGDLAAIQTALRHFLTELNRALTELMLAGQFITFQIGLLLLGQRTLLLGNAGHPLPLVWRQQTQQCDLIDLSSNVPLGLFPEWVYDVTTLPFLEGDKLLLYTDGVIERRNDLEEEFGVSKLLQAVRANAHLSPRLLIAHIVQLLRTFGRSAEPHDDQAMLAIEFLPPRPDSQP